MISMQKLPEDLGEIVLKPSEVLYYLYLPVSMKGDDNWVTDMRLSFLHPLLEKVRENDPGAFVDNYVYVTAKRMFVGGGVTPNRPGWHADGFLSSDINYVWYDCIPTLFNKGLFVVEEDHVSSLVQFEEQADPSNIVTFPDRHLLKLDSSVVHAVGEATAQVMRTFIKISVSPNKYNLEGNSHNYILDYNWTMFDRATLRNDPARAQRDSVDDDHFA